MARARMSQTLLWIDPSSYSRQWSTSDSFESRAFVGPKKALSGTRTIKTNTNIIRGNGISLIKIEIEALFHTKTHIRYMN